MKWDEYIPVKKNLTLESKQICYMLIIKTVLALRSENFDPCPVFTFTFRREMATATGLFFQG